MPPSVTRLRLQSRARADLADIFRYSVDAFGVDRARRCIVAFDEVMLKLARGELSSTQSVKRGMWKVRVGSHNLYFRRRPDTIVVIRVLHQAMDAPRHLRGR